MCSASSTDGAKLLWITLLHGSTFSCLKHFHGRSVLVWIPSPPSMEEEAYDTYCYIISLLPLKRVGVNHFDNGRSVFRCNTLPPPHGSLLVGANHFLLHRNASYVWSTSTEEEEEGKKEVKCCCESLLPRGEHIYLKHSFTEEARLVVVNHFLHGTKRVGVNHFLHGSALTRATSKVVVNHFLPAFVVVATQFFHGSTFVWTTSSSFHGRMLVWIDSMKERWCEYFFAKQLLGQHSNGPV